MNAPNQINKNVYNFEKSPLVISNPSLPFLSFPLAIVLYVLFRYTASEYPFDIFIFLIQLVVSQGP